ncbi:MAG: hypothetical protein ACTHK3_03325 [Solirubrobacterales bacterium]
MTVDLVQHPSGESAAAEIPPPERIDTIAQALADETRRQLLKFLVETGRTLSATKAGRALFLETKRLNRQLNALYDAELVFLAEARPVRGATEKLFMATPTALEDPIVRAALDATELWPGLASVT